MSELMRVNWTLLKKKKLFWIAVVGVSALEIIFKLPKIINAKSMAYMASAYLIGGLPEFSFAPALSIGIFLGMEYSRGTVKNRIIAGYSRFQIYCSYLMISICIALIWFMAYLTCSITVFIFTGTFYTIQEYMLFIALHLFSLIIQSALVVLVFFMMRSAAGCIAVSVILWLLLWSFGVRMDGMVGSSSVSVERLDSGEIIAVDNEDALERGSESRETVEYLYTTLPVAQFVAISGNYLFELYIVHEECTLRIVLSGVVWLAVLIFAGNMLFRYKKVR